MALPEGIAYAPTMAEYSAVCRRTMLVSLASSALGATIASEGHAGAARPVSLTHLVSTSQLVTVGVARESTSRWVYAYGGRRIITYTRFEILQPLIDEAATSVVYVETLGGTVGKIAQVVHGEANLIRNQPCVAFLRGSNEGLHRLTARAQGHYRLAADNEGIQRLYPSPKLADFTHADRYGAVSRLRGRSVSACQKLVKQERVGAR